MSTVLSQREQELFRVISESSDPAKAMVIAIDIIQRIISGKDPESIKAMYSRSTGQIAETK